MASPTSVERSQPEQSWLTRLTMDRLMFLLMLLAIFAQGLSVKVQSDTWWLLRSGKHIIETGAPLTRELWSFSVPGGYWPNHETLAEILFYLGYQLGGFPLIALGCATMLTAVWYGLAQLAEGPMRLRAATLLMCQLIQAMNYGLRPYLFTLCFIGLVIILLPHRRLHWLYPAVFLIWANTHGGVAFGGMVLVIATAVAFFTDRQQLGRWLLITTLSGLATLINPLGIGLWELVIVSFNNPVLKLTQEWRSPRLDWPYSYPMFILALATSYAAVRTRHSWRGHRDVTILICGLVFMILGFRAMRHSAVFAMIAPLIITRCFAHLPASKPATRTDGTLNAVLLGATALVLSLLVWQKLPTTRREQPLSAEMMAAIRQCDGPLFTTFDNGGLLLWWVPERAVFVDNRQDPYPHELILRSWRAEDQGEYRELFAEYRMTCAFVPHDLVLTRTLQADRWTELARDSRYVVLQRGAE